MSKDAQAWISVEDRLPSNDCDGCALIVVVTNGIGQRISETDTRLKLTGAPGGTFDFWGSKVTHWMPLPAPPAKHGDDK